jgi:hypothetical protein
VAAKANNGFCGVGVAYEASISAIAISPECKFYEIFQMMLN